MKDSIYHFLNAANKPPVLPANQFFLTRDGYAAVETSDEQITAEHGFITRDMGIKKKRLAVMLFRFQNGKFSLSNSHQVYALTNSDGKLISYMDCLRDQVTVYDIAQKDWQVLA